MLQFQLKGFKERNMTNNQRDLGWKFLPQISHSRFCSKGFGATPRFTDMSPQMFFCCDISLDRGNTQNCRFWDGNSVHDLLACSWCQNRLDIKSIQTVSPCAACGCACTMCCSGQTPLCNVDMENWNSCHEYFWCVFAWGTFWRIFHSIFHARKCSLLMLVDHVTLEGVLVGKCLETAGTVYLDLGSVIVTSCCHQPCHAWGHNILVVMSKCFLTGHPLLADLTP